MTTKVTSLTYSGIDIVPVDVQIQISPGLPSFIIVGLADKTVAESKERVKAALSAMGLALPSKRIVVNLSPADLIKEGSHFDLAIALGILANMNVIAAEELSRYLIFGELSLDGCIIGVNGALPAAIGAISLDKGVICASENGAEAAWSGNEQILAAKSIISIVNHFKGISQLIQPVAKLSDEKIDHPDLQDIKGQKIAKRVLEIAAAGGHNLLMFGPPGSGKSMLAERLNGILPRLDASEILEISMIASIAGLNKSGELTMSRPFKAPHHSCTMPAMVGGGMGRRIKPGEISLAHNGVLFLDELPEFQSSVIESLRQPIETGKVNISRSGMQVSYPANFQLVAAMNPCKCGYLTDPDRACSRAPACAQNYMSKVSGPILDRFDLHIEVAIESNFDYLTRNAEKEECSAQVLKRVEAARELQAERYNGLGVTTNARLTSSQLVDFAMPYNDGMNILNEAAKKFKLSMRAYNKVIKVARTIADLAGSKGVHPEHISEALSYRQMKF